MCEVETKNISNDLQALKEYFDFSNYPKNHPLHDPSRKNKAGLWKNEVCNGVITKFCGLKSKSYAFKTVEGNKVSEKITCKGVNKGGKKALKLNDYFKCLKSIKSIRTNVTSIRSYNYVLSTIQLNKLALTSFDDKRFLFHCAIHSAPYGSTLIHKYNKWCPFCEPNFFKTDVNVRIIDVTQ